MHATIDRFSGRGNCSSGSGGLARRRSGTMWAFMRHRPMRKPRGTGEGYRRAGRGVAKSAQCVMPPLLEGWPSQEVENREVPDFRCRTGKWASVCARLEPKAFQGPCSGSLGSFCKSAFLPHELAWQNHASRYATSTLSTGSSRSSARWRRHQDCAHPASRAPRG